MDRQTHDYASAMAFAQQQQQQAGLPPQQYGFHPPPQQFSHGPPFLSGRPPLQQFPPYNRPLQQQPIYPHHHVPPQLQHQQQLPPPYGAHAPPHVVSPAPFMPPFDAPPPPVAPPLDPELHKRIEKLVEYIAKNGPEFEAVVCEKEHDNPDFSFLFGAEGHHYYRYKLWLSTRHPGSLFNTPYPASSMSMLNAPTGQILGGPLHSGAYPPYYDQHAQHAQPFMAPGRLEYDPTTRSFKGLAGPLPSDVAAELGDVLSNLSGTKESIKGAKMWFMQRSPFAPALAESLRERIFALDDPERQLHIIFLANDILFDSLQRRSKPDELDNEALAFKPLLGSMFARIYNNPSNSDANQSRLEKILDFWASKGVYDADTIANFQREMTGGAKFLSAPSKEGTSDATGLQQGPPIWKQEKTPDYDSEDQLHSVPAPQPQFASTSPVPLTALASATPASFPVTLPIRPAVQPPSVAGTNASDLTPPPYPLFPPGLIPGMVRKMQIGSGVPYSPLSPLDIPTIIPPSTVPESEILDRVSKFFKEIGEVNPSEGPMGNAESVDYDDYERDIPVRQGGACIPPPANLQVDSETGTRADGSFDSKPGSTSSGRLGLGATANPNEISQYDDVYSSYRKQRSTSYHTSMSARSSTSR